MKSWMWQAQSQLEKSYYYDQEQFIFNNAEASIYCDFNKNKYKQLIASGTRSQDFQVTMQHFSFTRLFFLYLYINYIVDNLHVECAYTQISLGKHCDRTYVRIAETNNFKLCNCKNHRKDFVRRQCSLNWTHWLI